eukprot:12087800-Alexandrium_andersonii.AAC.1
MSASLVGSEMCIRDRFSRGQLKQQHPGAATATAQKPARPTPRQEAVRPVSYTHLTLPTICSV